MVLELLISDFQLKNTKVMSITFITKLMQNTINELVHTQTIEIQKKVPASLSWQIDIPAFCAHYNTQIQCQFKDLKQNILQTTTSIIQNNQIEINTQQAQFKIEMKKIESSKKYHCIEVKMLEQMIPCIVFPLSNQNLSLQLKYRLYNGTFYSLSQQYTNQFVIYKQQDNVVYLEGYIQIGDIEIVLIQLQVTNEILQKLIFKLSYLTPMLLAILDLLMYGTNTNTSTNNVNKYLKLSLSTQNNLAITNQQIIQKVFAKQVQSSFSNSKNAKKNDKSKGPNLDQQIQKELNALGYSMDIYDQIYQQFQAQFWHIKIYGTIQKSVIDTINFKIQQQIEQIYMQSQNIFGFLKIYDAGNNFDIVVCQLNNNETDVKSVYPQLTFHDIEQNAQYVINKQVFEQQVIIQQKVSMHSMIDDSQMIIIPATYENQDFVLGNILAPIKFQSSNCANKSLFFYFYKNNQVINQYKISIQQLQKEYQQETLIQIPNYLGIQFKYCLTNLNIIQDVSNIQEPQKQTQPLATIQNMMSTDVEAFENARKNYLIQQGLPVRFENINVNSTKELQSLQEHLNDISAIEQQKPSQRAGKQLQLRQTEQSQNNNLAKTLDNQVVDTSILDMNDMNQLVREQNKYDIQNDIQKLENQINYIGDINASSNEELKQIIDKYQQISINQQQILRHQGNTLNLYDKNDEIDPTVQSPDLSYEERQFIEMFLKRPGMFTHNDYVQNISRSFQKYDIAENVVKSILTRYYVQQASNLHLSDEVQQNEELIQKLEQRIKEEMEQDYLKEGNTNESYKNKKLGESFLLQKESQFQLMNKQ